MKNNLKTFPDWEKLCKNYRAFHKPWIQCYVKWKEDFEAELREITRIPIENLKELEEKGVALLYDSNTGKWNFYVKVGVVLGDD